MQTRPKSEFIEGIRTVAIGLTTAIVIWLAQTTNTSTERLTRIEERVSSIGSDRYSATEAKKDFEVVQERLEALAHRIERLEGKK